VRICIIGKFPPIQGGVSMRTYWTAHALAARGHEVHVVTNAKEAGPPFRMLMRAPDWDWCEPKFAAGAVTVHWSDPVDRSQSYIPSASPFITKLATLAADAHSSRPFDVIFSHYMEPYGIAGHLAAQMTGVPHVVRMAGSDAGRLWHHPQFEALYDHVLRSAAAVVATGTVAERAAERGVDPGNIVFGGGYAVPEHLFTAAGPALDIEALRAELAAEPALRNTMWGAFSGAAPCLGVYGKLGARKGSFALLAAMHRLKLAGAEFGLLALAHGNEGVEQQFRQRASELGLTDQILQIPFLPHWRVPEFLRRCLAVCCLEQDFPIGFHSPIIPREILLCGTCLVGSTEVIKKLPDWERLPNGYGCVAVEDVNDVDALTERLGAVVRDPQACAIIGSRGRSFAQELERSIDFPGSIEGVLAAAAERRTAPKSVSLNPSDSAHHSHNFKWAETAAAKLVDGADVPAAARPIDLVQARKILKRLERAIDSGRPQLRSLAQAVQVEVAIAEAERDADKSKETKCSDPLFRLQTRQWAFDARDLAGLVPVRGARQSVVRFEFDVAALRDVGDMDALPEALETTPSHVVVFARTDDYRREPLQIDGFTAQVLELGDGTRTAGEIVTALGKRAKSAMADNLKWIEQLFVLNLIQLRNKTETGRKAVATTRRGHRAEVD
jgi:glycosyltransferase involved in cell wall biosynthesis